MNQLIIHDPNKAMHIKCGFGPQRGGDGAILPVSTQQASASASLNIVDDRINVLNLQSIILTQKNIYPWISLLDALIPTHQRKGCSTDIAKLDKLPWNGFNSTPNGRPQRKKGETSRPRAIAEAMIKFVNARAIAEQTNTQPFAEKFQYTKIALQRFVKIYEHKDTILAALQNKQPLPQQFKYLKQLGDDNQQSLIEILNEKQIDSNSAAYLREIIKYSILLHPGNEELKQLFTTIDNVFQTEFMYKSRETIFLEKVLEEFYQTKDPAIAEVILACTGV